MAALTDADFTAYRRLLGNDSIAQADMKAAGLTKSAWKAVFQAFEDKEIADVATHKSLADTATGQTLTDVLARKMRRAWQRVEADK